MELTSIIIYAFYHDSYSCTTLIYLHSSLSTMETTASLALGSTVTRGVFEKSVTLNSSLPGSSLSSLITIMVTHDFWLPGVNTRSLDVSTL